MSNRIQYTMFAIIVILLCMIIRYLALSEVRDQRIDDIQTKVSIMYEKFDAVTIQSIEEVE